MAAKSIQDTVTIVPELRAIAKEIKTLTMAYAPVKTGNLRKTIGTYNNDSNMIRVDSKNKFTITIEYGPPGAEYGQFWDEPATSKSTTRHRPEFGFPTKAVEDKKVTDLIDLYIKSLETSVGNTIELSIGNKK
jgi:hypothetical protein